MDIQTAKELSDAHKNIKKLIIEQNGKLDKNEANTRFHVIDIIIQGVLGWERSSFNLETAQNRNYSDYELGAPLQMIWEAKREGISFTVPVKEKRSLVHEISSVSSASEGAKEAILQVNRYCLDRGCELAVATNGHQFIIFSPNEPDVLGGISGKCLVISSLNEFEKNLSRIWDFLSPEGVRQRSLQSFLQRMAAPSAPKKLSSLVPYYPQHIQPNNLQQSLANMAHLLLINIEMQEDIERQFYAECYCESGALSQHALMSKQMLNSRYASLFPIEEAAPRVEPVMAKPGKPLLTPEVLSDAISNRPIVLLGDVGVGKSSFLKHLMYVSAYDEFQRALYIYVDLGRTGALSSDLKNLVLEQVEKILLEEYGVDIFEVSFIRSVYKNDIKRFDRGIYGALKEKDVQEYEKRLLDFLAVKQSDYAAHTKASIGYLAKERRKQVIIALDNSDQRDSETQQEAFIISQTMASEWKATVFVSMRPRTFYQSKKSGALSAYPHRVFTISPPRIDNMIRKRIRFALDVAEGRRNLESLSHIRLNLSNISAFLHVIINTVNKSDDVNIFLENITGGNIRLLIELIANTIGSPNIDTEGVVRGLEEYGEFVLPIHDWWKVAIRGDYRFYDPSKSLVVNIFSVFSPDKKEHFLIPMILAYLDSNGNHKNGEGFVTYLEICREMQVWGYKLSSIESAIRFANNMKIIESNRRVTFDEDEAGLYGSIPELWRVNTAGVYYLKVWMTTFSYLDDMAIDISLFDEELYENLASNIRFYSLNYRIDRAKAVKDYLSDVWDSNSISVDYFDWSVACRAGEISFEKAERALAKRGGR